eukprot:TRINITY_DN5859_c0_g4_i1.p2 TRINITY_DN5859_c0_g4~~TRINITY_DN5859_c0_g4_i1.p2  ORF type:complete len:822 (-),score=179.48 TRINITY_DN5859_c0_g4_i1:4-2469(-)
MNASSLAFIPQSFPGYPITDGIPFQNNPVRGAWPGTTQDGFFMVAAANAFVRVKFDLRNAAVESVEMADGDIITSANYDANSRFFYIGLNSGRLWRYEIPDINTPLSASNVTKMDLNTSSDVTNVMFQLDRDFIYAVTAGSGSQNVSTVVRLQSSTFSLNESLALTGQDFGIVDADIDTVRGYIVLIGNPEDVPRIAQVDLPTFTQEYTKPMTDFLDGVIKFSSVFLDRNRKRIFVASVDSLLQTQLTLLTASDNCPGECFGHGNCSYRSCSCFSFSSPLDPNQNMRWLEPSCEGRTCEYNCSNTVDTFHGTCAFNGSCICDRIWSGRFCELRQCPQNCSGNGVCGGAASNYTCSCNDGFSGDACNQVALLRCPLYKTCSECGQNPACGWCGTAAGGSGGFCLDGDARGPSNRTSGLYASCRNWHYQECDVIVGIINWVVTALLGLVLIVALVSVPLEFAAGNGDEYSRRLSWYRFQRSAKVLALFLQLNYVGALTFLNSVLPTAFTTFTRTWLWPNFAIGLPFNKFISALTIASDPSYAAPASRQLLNFEQFLVYSETTVDLILPGVLFWWVVILGICYFLFFVSIGLAKIFRGDREHAIGQWLLYILFSGLNWGYFPLTFFGFVQMGLGPRSLVALAGAAVVLVVGIGYPVFIFIIVRSQNRKLFAEHNKIRYFPLIGHAVPRHLNLATIPYIKNFLVALFLGVLTGASTIAQLIMCMIVFLGWGIFIAIKGDIIYSDYLQRRLEVVLAIVHFVSFGIILAFAANLLGAAITGISLTFIIIQLIGVIVCLLFFVITWLQAREVYSCSQFAAFLCCRSEK